MIDVYILIGASFSVGFGAGYAMRENISRRRRIRAQVRRSLGIWR